MKFIDHLLVLTNGNTERRERREEVSGTIEKRGEKSGRSFWCTMAKTKNRRPIGHYISFIEKQNLLDPLAKNFERFLPRTVSVDHF